jgi:repressor LexA
MLTRKQRDLLILIHERMKDGDVAPSFEEMKEALGLKSKSGIHRLIGALVERGYLERLPHRARALQVRKLPDGYVPGASAAQRSAAPSTGNVTTLHRPALPKSAPPSSGETIPLYGKIAAGTPIEAIRDEGRTVEVPAALLGNGTYYALEVSGDSMINAGIHDKDTVIIQEAETAENGAIVVALVDDAEVTLKRFRRSGNKIILEPENDQYEPRVLDPTRVKIQGKLASLYRTYH